ncbi:MAG: amidohydrolase family protein [Sphingobium sp.]
MADFDVAIVGGTIVDGSGGAPFAADIGIRAGRVARIGRIGAGEAARTVDATGRLVTPGFVDVHTHFDAQLLWDGSATPSINHGVTSIACGNCGYTLAPVEPDGLEFIKSLMARVEGIPLESLEQLDWSWRSWADYFDRFEGKVGPNVAISVGHPAVRRKVMGEAASSQKATPAQIAEMAREVRAAVDAGAMGFSSSQSPIHLDAAGEHVPSWFAEPEELIAICAALKGSNARILEFIPRGVLTEVSPEDTSVMAEMSRAAGLPLNWNTLSVDPADLGKHERQMAAYTAAAGDDAKVVALMLPVQPMKWISFATGVTLQSQPGFSAIFQKKTIDERIAVLLDPSVRETIRNAGKGENLGNVSKAVDWGDLTFAQIEDPALKHLLGRKVGEVAAERGVDPLDLVIETAVADRLRTGFTRERLNQPQVDAAAARAWADGRVVVGASDAGAHVDLQCGGTFTTDFLTVAVRERKLMPIEQAIRVITDVPARFYGMTDRGLLREGAYADINVIDFEALDVADITERNDLPANGPRVFGSAKGYDHVFVNGVEVIEKDRLTGARPGTLLRSNAR